MTLTHYSLSADLRAVAKLVYLCASSIQVAGISSIAAISDKNSSFGLAAIVTIFGLSTGTIIVMLLLLL